MRFIPVVALTIAVLLQSSIGLTASPEWRRVPFAPAEVTAPESLLDSEDAIFEIRGAYPDACYRNGPIGAKVDPGTGEIVIKNEAWRLNSDFCAFQLRPFTRTINLGKLPAGTYRVLSHSDSHSLREYATLIVERSR